MLDPMKGVSVLRQQDGAHGGWRSAKKCVTTYLPRTLALKMDGAEAGHAYGVVPIRIGICRWTCGGGGSVRVIERGPHGTVEMLVVVAMIQVRPLKTVLEEGFETRVIGLE